MSELIDMTKVYIIESPSTIDIIDKNMEGDALGKTLDLAKIENISFEVSDVETLRIAYRRIADDVNINKSNWGGIHLHFSMHGNNDGVELTNRTFLDWHTFYHLLKEFNDAIGYINLPSGLKISPTYLAFSVCHGFEARIIKEFGEESPYTGLIGPTKPVAWADSLLAFSIFYHNTILKKTGVLIAIENMNNVLGLKDLFQIDPGKEMILNK